jgi:hypothetical protein
MRGHKLISPPIDIFSINQQVMYSTSKDYIDMDNKRWLLGKKELFGPLEVEE